MKIPHRDKAGAFTEIGSGDKFAADWQGGVSDFVLKTIAIGAISYTVPADHELEAKLVVGTLAADDMLFAYDTISFNTYIVVPVGLP